jgi:hypothetical protein
MAISQQTALTHDTSGKRAAFAVTRWVLTVVGGISAFMGGFILLGGDDQYVGLGGDISWRVGDIDPIWGWGLLLVGALFFVVGIQLLISNRGTAAEDTVDSARTDLIAHAFIFVLVNGFLWLQNYVVSGGIDYVLWVTIPWAIGLGVQAIGYFARKRA